LGSGLGLLIDLVAAMTSMSAMPTPVVGAPETKAPAPAPAPRKGGIDYSKFDNIEDSDDEKPKESASAAAKPAEKPHCHNCHKETLKPLRCGVCKKAEYCSSECQKDDWRYHKRTCKKPEAPKAKAEPSPAAPKTASEESRKRREEEKVVETDENLTWYRHREWRPEEPKQEFKPTQISGDAAAGVAEAAKPTAGSAWNAAGTWEEKDVTAMAQKTLKERLNEPLPGLDVAGGSLAAGGTEAVEGEASKPVIRGKLRHMFDLSFKVKFVFKWMESGGQRKAEGHIEVNDFTNDTFTEGVMTPPAVQLSLKDTGLEAGRRRAVEQASGAGAWPPESGTLLHGLAARMEAWAKEFTEAT